MEIEHVLVMTKMTRMSGLLEALAMRFANQGGWRPSNKISNEAFVWILRKHPVYVKWSWIHGWHRPSCKVVYHLRPLTRGRCISSEQVHDTRQPNFLWIVWMMINAIHFWDLILFKFFLITTIGSWNIVTDTVAKMIIEWQNCESLFLQGRRAYNRKAIDTGIHELKTGAILIWW